MSGNNVWRKIVWARYNHKFTLHYWDDAPRRSREKLDHNHDRRRCKKAARKRRRLDREFRDRRCF